MTRDEFVAMFPENYWTQVKDRLGHDFLDTHWIRTTAYLEHLKSFDGKRVLEVGGFPGTLLAVLKHFRAVPTSIDSPTQRPDYFLDWCKTQGIDSLMHDITSGAPPISNRFHLGIMSDVLLHIDGFPILFWEWMVSHCDELYMINYLHGNAPIRAATHHDLHQGFAIEGDESIISLTKAFGGKFKVRHEVAGRGLLIFEGRHE